MFKWIKSLFSRKVDEVVEKEVNVVYDELEVHVTYTHPTKPFRPARKPAQKPKAPKVSAEDIRSWINAVREYDSLSSALRL